MLLAQIKVIKIYTNFEGNVVIVYRENGEKKKTTLFYKPYYWIKKENGYEKVFYNYSTKREINVDGTYELDLYSHQLFLLDNNVITFENKYRVLYFDIETKDTSGAIDIGKDRIISICAIDDEGKEYKFCDDSEKKILLDFSNILPQYDILVGYNCDNFDIPYLKIRYKVNGIFVNFRDFNIMDMMKQCIESGTIKDLISKSLTNLESYSLDNVSKIILGEGKEWIDKVEGFGGALWELFNKDRDKLLKYNLQDVILLKKIDSKFNFTGKLIALSLLGGVNVEDTIYYSRVIDMIILKHARERKIHYPSKNREVMKKREYTGALTIQPSPGLYKNIALFDFVSLYANIVRAWNISTETLRDKDSSDICIETPNGSRFISPSHYKGIVPTIFDELLVKKTDLKRVMKSHTMDSELYLKAKLELEATKLTILTGYGINGSGYSRYYSDEIANAITACGRYLLENMKKYLDSHGYLVIYGDTDSCFIQVKDLRDVDVVKKLIKECLIHLLGEERSRFFEMDFEKLFSRIIIPKKEEGIGAKKKYIGLVVFDKIDCSYIYGKGTEIVKADQCLLTKRLFIECIEYLLKDIDPQPDAIITIITKYRKMIMNGEAQGNDIIIIKKVSKLPEEYKSMPVHVKLALEEKNAGGRYYTSQKVPFIVVSNSPLKVVSVRNYAGVYDRKYYWQNQVFPPVQRLLEAIFPEILWNSYLDVSGQKTLI